MVMVVKRIMNYIRATSQSEVKGWFLTNTAAGDTAASALLYQKYI